MRTLRTADLVTGALAIGAGLVTLLASRSIKAMAGESLDPRTLPMIGGLGHDPRWGGIVYSGWRYRGAPGPRALAGYDGLRRLAVTAVLLLLYVALIGTHRLPHRDRGVRRGSFLVPRPLSALGHRPGRLATGLVVYYVFMQLLELTFPLGLIEYLY